MNRTLGDIHRAAKYQVSAHLRTIARQQYEKANLPRVCVNCGYDRHAEICHVKPISSFPNDAPVAVINDLANLVALCPNCHWELDHGVLRL
ncbi:MAG: HNH endonuclease [Chloroflexota bacterium]